MPAMQPMGSDEDPPKLGSPDADDFAPAPLPIGPDGNPNPGLVGNPAPLPPATADNWVCLRGPCRHYMTLVEAGEFGNPAGTFESLKDADGNQITEPRQHQHWCLGMPGQVLEMTEGMVFKCNRWDPVDPDAAEELAKEWRRKKYLKLHPEHDPVVQDAATEALLREILSADAAPDEKPFYPRPDAPPDWVPADGVINGIPMSPGQREAIGLPVKEDEFNEVAPLKED